MVCRQQGHAATRGYLGCCPGPEGVALQRSGRDAHPCRFCCQLRARRGSILPARLQQSQAWLRALD
eukprot:scaffold7247_cov484-Prasinococcus_capsulatus_cf.AAC.5